MINYLLPLLQKFYWSRRHNLCYFILNVQFVISLMSHCFEQWNLFKPEIIGRSSPKGQPLHQHNSLDNPANDSESLKAPSSILHPNSTTWYSTQLYEPNSLQPTLHPTLHPTLLNSTLLNPTHHLVSVPSQAIPHPIRSRDQCQDDGRRPHRSVGPTTGTHLPEVGEWNRIRYTLK